MNIKIANTMRRTEIKSAAILTLTAAGCLFGFTACAQLKSWVTQPGTVEQLAPASTNLVTVVVTNTVTIPAQTNAATGALTPASVQIEVTTNITPVVQPAVYFTNLDLAPIVQNGINAADTAASAAGIPWSHTVAEIVLAIIGGLLSWTNFRNRQKLLSEIGDHANTQSALSEAQAVAQTLVQNFEQLRQVALTIPGYTRQIDDKVMTAIQAAQQIAGVKDQINSLVDGNTNTTIPGN
jgi:ABC-type transporter Mla subunit MlaD